MKISTQIFLYQEIFFVNFDFKNGCKNDFEDINVKSWSRFKNRVPLEIDFRADWTHVSNPTARELRYYIYFRKKLKA